MPSCRKNKRSFFIESVTLQVRIHIVKSFPAGRVCLSASFTVEAALALSLFVFAVMTMMIPMKVMDNQRRIQASLESAAEEISQYAYLVYLQQQGRDSYVRNDSNANADEFSELATEAYVLSKVRKYLDRGIISHISLESSEILADGETITLNVNYSMRLPFPVFRIKEIPLQAVSRRRAWIGSDGGLGENGGSSEEDPIVYVGKGSTRYHWSVKCHYLDNRLSSYPKESIDSVRNESGRKYSPCSVCGRLAGERNFVYVLPYGTSYHSRFDCTSIAAYVKAVPLSAVEYLGACSYCSGKKGEGE